MQATEIEYVGRIASEDQSYTQLKVNCSISILLYALECVPSNNRDIMSIDFTVNRLIIKLFKSSNTDTTNERKNSFAFQLHSEILQRRKL